jgi:hypothetical protein
MNDSFYIACRYKHYHIIEEYLSRGYEPDFWFKLLHIKVKDFIENFKHNRSMRKAVKVRISEEES